MWISLWQTCQCQDFSPSDESHPNIEQEAPTVCLVKVEQGTKYLLWTTGTRGLGVSRSLSLILALLPSLEPWAHCFRSHLLMEKDEQYICLSLLMKEYNNVKMMSKYYSVHRNSRTPWRYSVTELRTLPRGGIPESPYKKDILDGSDIHTTRSRSHSL